MRPLLFIIIAFSVSFNLVFAQETVATSELAISADSTKENKTHPVVLEESQLRQLIVKTARELIGVKYRFGGNSIAKGLDCSSFVQKTFAFYNISLPRNTREQFLVGFPIENMEDLLPGDLVFFAKKKNIPSHVGIFANKEKVTMIHNRRKKGIEETYLDRPYYKNRYLGGLRIIGVNLNSVTENKGFSGTNAPEIAEGLGPTEDEGF
ncbi:MAG: C40 family peptidase [Pseudomonadota bacterium]